MSRVLEIERIAIKNLFSYYASGAPITFDLQGIDPEGGRNVVIIAGRNGYGKTGLLNSIRLLLFGAVPWVQKVITRGSYEAISLTTSTFFLGQPGYWDGVFNSRARNESQRDYFVEITWREPAGQVSIRRTWTLTGDTFAEDFRITVPPSMPQPTDLKQFVEDRLPPAYAPFYLFDGEDLQRLAETFASAAELRLAIRQLLGIQRVDELIAVLDEIARSLPRRARVVATSGDLQKEEETDRILHANLDALDAKEKETKLLLTRTERQLEAGKAELDELRQRGFATSNAQALNTEARAIEARLATWLMDFGSDFIPLSPLMANPELVQAAQRHALAVIATPDNAARHVLQQLQASVLSALADAPFSTPPLTPGQETFYVNRIKHRVQEFASSTESAEGTMFADLSADRIHALVDRLGPYVGAHELRRTWFQRIQQVLTDQHRFTQIQQQLEAAPTTTDAIRSRFEELVRQQLTLSMECDGAKKFLQELPDQRRAISQKLGQTRSRLQTLRADLEERRRLASRGHQAAQLAQGFFPEYVKLLERTRYGRLAAKTTEHWHQLMESHELVQRVELDASFRVRFKDTAGEEVGSGSLSEGMKQLAATAFLWSLADETEQRFPVMFDTPLGRIDLGHQQRILRDYVPRAARQVIILPTDSELDHAKYELLRPHVYREYHLTNPTGRSTVPTLGSLWKVPGAR